ncbi:glycosyltransferase [Flavobacterium sp. Arc3]|uniref:glycosyltransferase n=1 Tax=unclassified Flavobacterium TaxID=196869 RepID=UPI00352DF10E
MNPQATFVVSIASYPKRSHLLPAVYEALNKQKTVPKKWILVLSEEEWPDLTLPNYLNKLVKRGLEIIWVRNNTYAVKKLVPVLIKYPDLGAITLDDDIIYGSNLIENLVTNTYAKKGNIVGHVGKTLIKKNNELNMMFRDTVSTNINTNTNQVFLIGWGGIYYPNNSLSPKVKDADAIKKIVPGRGSDIWFWAAALAQNTKQYCIAPHSAGILGIPIPTTKSTKPKDTPAADLLERRFQMSIDFFEIREKLLANLPNKL